MTLVALVNPNTDRATTAMMAAIARRTLRAEHGYEVRGVTVAAGPPMLVDEEALRASAGHVLDAAARLLAGPDGARVAALVVGAFGDPGVEELRARTPLPVVGLAEAAMREAGAGARRFGIATTTPDLAAAIDARVTALGWSPQYTGIRLTTGDPRELAARTGDMTDRLASAVDLCVREDGAEAVIIGGGPLGEAAEALRHRLPVPVVGPIPAAARQIRLLLGQPARECPPDG
ncbi:aspartate/glutamate racemase family protein [Streptomyces sp. NRRL F-5727]|uniref:aspartate/glutamate racemase family protein n=1 Tax=Streptomyces sp. NRRL F-5727 TaxID=1463871 RepID=UPI0004C7F4EC|nr:aspartate/glutamate racemase family protein [Streptomyces sp. NRRL F-5727]